MIKLILLSDLQVEQYRHTLLPGMCWYCPWFYNPTNPIDNLPYGDASLSKGYWDNHSRTRPPICVVCPDGAHWMVDGPANNSNGWDVQGTLPNITVAPSIVTPGYHGFLRDGVFTPDLEGRTYVL